MHPYLVNFLSLLCERGRLPAFCQLRRPLRAALAGRPQYRPGPCQLRGAAYGDTAYGAGRPHGETLGKHVLLEGTVSPSLIGGIRVEIDGRVWDGSLRGRLEELRGLLRGAVL